MAAVGAGDDISGVVKSADAGEAGVWVITETADLKTTFRKIVVTDDRGRFLVPDLPDSKYEVWVRGHGLPAGSADFHYYIWVDQFDTLGLGENVAIANGTTSDALVAWMPAESEMVTLRVPYPLGFYTRGLDGRVDDPKAGWKGRGLWAANGDRTPWLIEGGKGSRPLAAHFQLRPDPLAR